MCNLIRIEKDLSSCAHSAAWPPLRLTRQSSINPSISKSTRHAYQRPGQPPCHSPSFSQSRPNPAFFVTFRSTPVSRICRSTSRVTSNAFVTGVRGRTSRGVIMPRDSWRDESGSLYSPRTMRRDKSAYDHCLARPARPAHLAD
jgi:hypothetical protein